MPRRALLSDVAAVTADRLPDYFDSLDAIGQYCTGPGKGIPTYRVPYVPRASTLQPQLNVCHDYKGGYTESSTISKRDYTFRHWQYTSSFTYFSHHRLSLPPSSWISTAHRHGTKILGCLIFEHEESREDILKLVQGPGIGRESGNAEGKGFESLSLKYADYLVALAVERGFEGYLINVEVVLGVRQTDGTLLGSELHATALREWLSYLKREVEDKILGGEIVWYDAVTTDGQLAWQDQLTPKNQPFFEVAHSIFLNYTWQPQYPHTTATSSDTGQHNSIYFGVDVWGRGQYGGGGMELWRSIELIQGAGRRNLSTALFAPGWSYESSDLGHSMGTRAEYDEWRADDDYLWIGRKETTNVLRERDRLLKARKEARGARRARELAIATSFGGGGSFPAPFDYNAAFAAFPAVNSTNHRPISSFFASHPPPHRNVFYTNFSEGSGHSFWLAGAEVLQTAWTDIAFHWPSLLDNQEDQCEQSKAAVITQDDAYMGSCSVAILLDGSAVGELVHLAATSVEISSRTPIRLTLVSKWTGKGIVSIELSLPTGVCSSSTVTRALENGWESRQFDLSLKPSDASPVIMSVISLSLSHKSSVVSSLLIGSVSLVQQEQCAGGQPMISGLQLNQSIIPDRQTSTLRWRIDHCASDRILSADAAWPQYLFYTVSHLALANGSSEVFLGTTFATEFDVDVREAGTYIVEGIRQDGILEGIRMRLLVG